MVSYILRRILSVIPILFGVALLTFLLYTVFGEDPVRIALGHHATSESIDALRHKWGMDLPLYQQFFEFLRQIVFFDYGESYSTGEKISKIFWDGALISFSLTAPPFFLSLIFNVAFALLISRYRDGFFDHISRFFFMATMSVSYLVYIIGFQYLLAYKLDLFPIQGYAPGFESIPYLLLPWIILFVVSWGPDVRMYRTIFLDQSKADYIRTAKAKGASEIRVLFIHLLKNAMIPILTNTVVAVPFLITGAFVMERYFSIPGIGDITITAIHEGDYPILKAMTMLSAILYTLFNLLTDLLYAFFDPRIKLE
jgi:peptide/nickel transport system permease protein